MPLSRNADYGNYLYTCNRCRSCAVEPSAEQRPLCPSYFFKGFFAYSGGGKGYVAQGILEKKIKPSAEVMELAMTCLLCGACHQACPPGFDTMSFIRDLRERLVKDGFYLSPSHRSLLSNLRDFDNPFGQPPPSSAYPLYERGEELLIFQGCQERKKAGADRSLLKILDAADVTFGVLKNEPCCGAPLRDLGQPREFMKKMRALAKKIKATNAPRLLLLCPHCASAFSAYSLEEDFEMELVTLPAFLAELLAEGRLKPAVDTPIKVTYHDPCRLARDLEETDPPREIFARLPGIELVEMPRSGEWTWCCGAGGGVSALVPELANFTVTERLREAQATTADTIITACGYCTDFLGQRAKKQKVKPLLDLVAERLA